MAARKKKSLVIVESPAKAKTINKYLGANFDVAASKGHVRDLPKSRFGIEIEKGWIPTYRNLDDRREVIGTLKKLAAKADIVYLAPDPDREGEAIAWHLKEALGLKDDRALRVTFNEITKRAVQEAFSQPGSIDMDRVAAQEARRFLDRIVGYRLSPLLSRQLASHLSAGRVQSVAVRLIVEREREIQAFKPEEYWKITALLGPESGGKKGAKSLILTKRKAVVDGEKDEVQKPASLPDGVFSAELAEWQGQKFQAATEAAVDQILARLNGSAYIVSKVEQKDRQERPSAPFTTSTLQQQASMRLGFSAKRTMMVAQRLYEGVELGGEGMTALITYMRTDSTRVSEDALKSCRQHIKKSYGDRYLPDAPNRYASGKTAQEAHEAIRPTDISFTPDRVKDLLPADQYKLYALIYNRFVASQMTPAEFAVTNVEIQADAGLFRAQGKTLKFDGYRRVLPPRHKQEDALLPPIVQNQQLDCKELISSQHFTQPPPRFNEASLIKTLEKEGIGRPSTYAAIISKIQDRGYVEQKERRFYATEIGIKVTDILVEHFPKVMDLKFTSHMEEELDQIEGHKLKRNDVLTEFYEPFQQALLVAESKMMADAEKCPDCNRPLVERFSRAGKFFGCSGYPECKYIKRRDDKRPREPAIPTEHVCPTCGKNMVQRMGSRGPFLGCSGYPDCRTTMNFDAEGKPVLASRPTEHACEKCGKPMVLREGSRGPFLACTGYPKCRNAQNVDREGNPIKPLETGYQCAKCGAAMVIRPGPRGPFMGCSAYPKCRSTKQIPDELKEKAQEMFPPPAKKATPAVEVSDTCPECGAPMKLRSSRRGYFLGCSKYPKCKGTKEAAPELLEQV